MSTPVYDRDYFIAKFEAIPDEMWCIGDYTEGLSRHCAMGHCGASHYCKYTDEVSALIQVLNCGPSHTVAGINDGYDLRYKQPTPKARILAALRDLPATANTEAAQ